MQVLMKHIFFNDTEQDIYICY